MWKARRDAGIGSAAMAELLGVSPNTVTNYESGRTSPPPTTVQVWAQVTGVDLSWLTGGTVVRRRRVVSTRPADVTTRGRSRHTRNARIRDARSGHLIDAGSAEIHSGESSSRAA
jgi:transcriptional regulator with XRE-family HTH domain